MLAGLVLLLAALPALALDVRGSLAGNYMLSECAL